MLSTLQGVIIQGVNLNPEVGYINFFATKLLETLIIVVTATVSGATAVEPLGAHRDNAFNFLYRFNMLGAN